MNEHPIVACYYGLDSADAVQLGAPILVVPPAARRRRRHRRSAGITPAGERPVQAAGQGPIGALMTAEVAP